MRGLTIGVFHLTKVKNVRKLKNHSDRGACIWVTLLITLSISSMKISRPVEPCRKCFDMTSPVGKASTMCSASTPLSSVTASSAPSTPDDDESTWLPVDLPPSFLLLILRRAVFPNDADGVKLRFDASNLRLEKTSCAVNRARGNRERCEGRSGDKQNYLTCCNPPESQCELKCTERAGGID